MSLALHPLSFLAGLATSEASTSSAISGRLLTRLRFQREIMPAPSRHVVSVLSRDTLSLRGMARVSPRRRFATSRGAINPHNPAYSYPEEPHMWGTKDGPWGFFPMKLGQLLKGKYEIVRKLGYGTHASIWLAKVQKDTGYKYVALKVLSVNASVLEFLHETHETEVAKSFDALPEANKEDPGYAHCAATSFVGSVNSKWGFHHICQLQPYGTSLGTLCAVLPRRRLSLSLVKRVVKQMLLALKFLHNRLHVVHGDLKLDNILVKLHASTEDIDRFLTKYPPQTYPHPPEESTASDTILTVRSQPLLNLGLDLDLSNLDVCVSDYGNTVRVDSIKADTLIFTAPQVIAPEHLLGHPWSYPADVWALGINTFLLLTGSVPLEHQHLVPGSKAAQLACMDALLGPFPTHFLQRCAQAAEYFDADGNLLHQLPSWEGSLEERLQESLLGEATPRDVRGAWRFVRSCLRIDPAERPTAQELLADPWLAT